MITIDGIPLAIVVMLCGLVFLGTAPAIWNKVEKAGRIPAHTMLDYTFAAVIVGVASTLTLGQLGPPRDGLPNFLNQIQQPNGPLVGFALASGVCLGVGDIALQYAVAFLGLTVGPPILNTIVVVLGTIFSYFLDGGINNAYLVFPGMSLAVVAIGLGVLAHCTSPAVQERRRDKSNEGQPSETKEVSMTGISFSEEQAYDLAFPSAHSLTIVAMNTEETAVSASTLSAAAVAVALPSIPPKIFPSVSHGQLPRTKLTRQSTASSMRSVQKADSSIYLGLAIAVAGERGFGKSDWAGVTYMPQHGSFVSYPAFVEPLC